MIDPESTKIIQNGRRVLRMVAELHWRGYQRIRIVPMVAPSGAAWRCHITSPNNISPTNGALWLDIRDKDPSYSTGDERCYFGWYDVAHLTVSKLANVFIERFPELAEEGRGRDWPYAGWYVDMLHITYPDVPPYAVWEDSIYRNPLPCISMEGGRQGVEVPAPPPGFGLMSDREQEHD